MVHSSDRLFAQPRHSGLSRDFLPQRAMQRMCSTALTHTSLIPGSACAASALGICSTVWLCAGAFAVAAPSRWGGSSLYSGMAVLLSGLYLFSWHGALVMLPKGTESVSLCQLPPGTVGTGLWRGQGCLLGTLEGWAGESIQTVPVLSMGCAIGHELPNFLSLEEKASMV